MFLRHLRIFLWTCTDQVASTECPSLNPANRKPVWKHLFIYWFLKVEFSRKVGRYGAYNSKGNQPVPKFAWSWIKSVLCLVIHFWCSKFRNSKHMLYFCKGTQSTTLYRVQTVFHVKGPCSLTHHKLHGFDYSAIYSKDDRLASLTFSNTVDHSADWQKWGL